jgi:integrase
MGIYLNPGSPYWHYVFKLPGKGRFRGTTGTADKELAYQIYIDKRSEAQKVQYGFQRPKIKLKDLINDYLELYAKHAKRTYKDTVGKLNKIKKFFGDPLANELPPSKIEEYRIRRLAEGVSKSTVNRELAVLKHVFNKGIEWGECSENPVRRIKFYSEKENARVRYLDQIEKTRLLNACSPAVRRLVFFALNSGMRQGEILNLLWKDIDFRTNIITIRHSKAGKPRYVPINSELINMLKSIPSVSEFVFGTKKGKGHWTLYRKPFEKAVRDSGLTNFRFHDLRHCFASDLVMKGIDLKTVSELLGHASTQMTERYSHLTPAHKLVAVEMLAKGLLGPNGAPVENSANSEVSKSL